MKHVNAFGPIVTIAVIAMASFMPKSSYQKVNWNKRVSLKSRACPDLPITAGIPVSHSPLQASKGGCLYKLHSSHPSPTA